MSDPKCNCQNIFTFTPLQYILGGGSIKSKLQKNFKVTQTTRKKFPKPAVNVTAAFIVVAVSAKTKNPRVGQVTTNFLKNISGGKNLSLTDLHGNGLRLKNM